MNKFENRFKKAFTIMEVGLSLMIVSILVIVSIPIIQNQAKKTDEYAYFLAFKTVEKMGSQIVALGDPKEPKTAAANNFNMPTKERNYLAIYTDKLFKWVSPKAHAATQTSEILSFPSYEYDYVRLCLGNKNVLKDDITYYNDAEIAAIQGEPLCKNTFSKNNFIEKRFKCPNMNYTEVYNELATGYKNTEQYCKWLANNCSNAYKCDSDKKGCYFRNEDGSAQCIITINDPDLGATSTLPGNKDDVSENTSSCDKLGYINMTKNGDGECICDPSHPNKAVNNSNVCCAAPSSGFYPYYIDLRNPCVYKNCKPEAFNEIKKTCCPSYSVYSPALGKCTCIDGYTPNDPWNLTRCSRSGNACPAGAHQKNNACVSNKPITSAKRLCELIAYHWNVSQYNCDTFTSTPSGNGNYYKTLYDEITKGGTTYLSAKAKERAFKNVTPNIVFDNGLRLWILSDKSASIAGLSFNPDGYTPNINTCAIKTNVTEGNCKTSPNFYCKNDDLCFSIHQGTTASKIEDARNCCSTTDFSDLRKIYAGDYIREPRTYAISGFTVFIDINGTKDSDDLSGGDTMWKDVFPFFIGTNGKVYPAYPLNAKKAGSTSKDNSALYQGGNSSALSADVFYYEISDNKRKKIVAYPSVPYARALCFSNEISRYTPYCLNLGSKYKQGRSDGRVDKFIESESNPCSKHKCFIKLKNKIKFL